MCWPDSVLLTPGFSGPLPAHVAPSCGLSLQRGLLRRGGGEGRACQRKRKPPGLLRPGLGSPRHPSALSCRSKPVAGLLGFKRRQIRTSLDLLVTSELQRSPLEFTFCHLPWWLPSHDAHSLLREGLLEHPALCATLCEALNRPQYQRGKTALRELPCWGGLKIEPWTRSFCAARQGVSM